MQISFRKEEKSKISRSLKTRIYWVGSLLGVSLVGFVAHAVTKSNLQTIDNKVFLAEKSKSVALYNVSGIQQNGVGGFFKAIGNGIYTGLYYAIFLPVYYVAWAIYKAVEYVVWGIWVGIKYTGYGIAWPFKKLFGSKDKK